MYSAYATFTLRCSAGTTGPSATQGAAAVSYVSQADADRKALGLAKRLAFEFITCTFPPGPTPVVYLSARAIAYASAEAGYEPETFTAIYADGGVYSTISQADADASAQLAAQTEANRLRDNGQKKIYYNVEVSYTNTCNVRIGPNYDPLTVTTTVAAAAHSSLTSQAHADYIAYNAAVLINTATLIADCVPYWLSAAVSYTATCSGGLVGKSVTVSYPLGQIKSYVSQVDADTTALANATAAALALVVCTAGFYSVEKSSTKTCAGVEGVGWEGDDSTATIPAGAYFAATQVDADALAQAAADTAAVEGLYCRWTGGWLP